AARYWTTAQASPTTPTTRSKIRISVESVGAVETCRIAADPLQPLVAGRAEECVVNVAIVEIAHTALAGSHVVDRTRRTHLPNVGSHIDRRAQVWPTSHIPNMTPC